ncbi:GntR family transcriptional regulator [Mycolicibacterium litorale]|nr:GntR family transcriptional regulator [Mycolicibacterium litorale]
MPKRYGIKEKDLVVAHILDLLLTGRLRTGDRVDRNDVAASLGLSRMPIQEALGQLEHDGILATTYHRGAFVQRFDADTLREHHEVHGLLTGATSARAAADRRPEILATLDGMLEQLRAATDPPAYITTSERYRGLIVETYAGPRLRAAIHSSRSLMPRTFWLHNPDFRTLLLPFAETENKAIHDGAPDRARRVCMDRADLMADIVISDLQRCGVFTEFRSS